jgi:hypothetical protein
MRDAGNLNTGSTEKPLPESQATTITRIRTAVARAMRI